MKCDDGFYSVSTRTVEIPVEKSVDVVLPRSPCGRPTASSGQKIPLYP